MVPTPWQGQRDGGECVQCLYPIYDPQIHREKLPYRAGQVYTIDLYAKRFKKPGKMGYFWCAREKEKKELSRTRRGHQTKV
jgi:hypothetical protein